MFNTENSEIADSVAIIGMVGRFPGANTVDELWKNLCEGIESINFFSTNDLNPNLDPELTDNPRYVKARGIIDAPDEFDATFFGMSPREAQVMDPQQRIFLETAWEALENAGYDPERYDGLIGVFGGTGLNSYYAHHVFLRPDIIEAFGKHQTNLANGPDYLTTRVSYKFNLRGPSISLYTGCSLSLVAVCHAFDSLMSYQCDLALAGASFIQCPLNSGYLYEEGEILSPDGHCRPFDEQAKGTVFSDGVGIVVLKRFDDALKDGDCIYAVIKGTAMNNDGSDKISFTAPSVNGQAEVIATAQANAEISPETISYIETHGTGTALGDPIEIEALNRAFNAKASAQRFCAIGSIKANIGHLDAAAGVAGLMKTALILYNKAIPPSINFSKPNSKINFQDSPFYVNTELIELNSDEHPLRAGVSSFGVGGTNAHIILEQAPQPEPSDPAALWQILSLSAKTSEALDSATQNLRRHLERHPGLNMSDVAYTLHIGRMAFDYRRVVVCRNVDNALQKIDSLDPRWVFTGRRASLSRDVAFIFSGQGSQYVNMGLDLYQHFSCFNLHFAL